MDDLDAVRQQMTTTTSDDDLDRLRRLVAARTWDLDAAARGRPTTGAEVDAGTPAPDRYVAPQPPPTSRSVLRPVLLVAAAALVTVLILVGGRSVGRVDGDPAAEPTDEGVEAAVPQLLDTELELRWPDIAWDASPAEKATFEATYRPRMEQLLTGSFASSEIEDRRRYAEFALARARNGPQPIVDDTVAVVTAIDDIDVDGTSAVAVVTYRQRIHVLRDPNPPGQLGSFVTDPDGWHETSDRAKVTLAWEDGWKIVSVASLIPGG